jgi:type II/III secretion system protein
VRKTFLFLAAIVMSASALQAVDDATVRVYVLKHKRVEEAALLIRPNLSESASITLTQKLNAMTVTDRPEKLDQIGRLLAAFDVPPRGFTFAVKLVRARADVPEGSIAREIGGLGAKLKSMFRFNDYALIDSVVLRVSDGGRVESRLGDEFVLSFTVRSAGMGNELLLSPFGLSRIYPSADGGPPLQRPLYRSSMPVKLSQTLVVGASREESSKSALILILLGQEVPRGDVPEKGSPGSTTVEKKP